MLLKGVPHNQPKPWSLVRCSAHELADGVLYSLVPGCPSCQVWHNAPEHADSSEG